MSNLALGCPGDSGEFGNCLTNMLGTLKRSCEGELSFVAEAEATERHVQEIFV